MRHVIYLCPSTPKGTCNWEGYQEDVVQHFEDCHKEYFLDTNSLDIKITQDNEVNYLMNQLNETYLIQTKYVKSAQTVELRVRYLGTAFQASKISYYVEVICGNFGFTSKNSGNGFETITSRNGVLYIDTQAIKVACGRSLLDTLVAWIHIENEFSQYTYKSIRRRLYDSKTLESKTRESFKRLSSYRTSMRKKSIDGLETVQTINKKLQEKRRSSTVETPDVYQKFVNEIVEDIFRDAMDEIEFKECCLADDKVQDSKSVNETCTFTEERNNSTTGIGYNGKCSKKKNNNAVIEYRPPDHFIQSIKQRMASFFSSSSNNITQYEDTIVLRNDQDFKFEIDIPYFEEDVVSSVKVATQQIANTEYIEENDRNSTVDAEDLRPCEWLLNGHATEKEKGNGRPHVDSRISEAEEMYWNNINRIRCQNCNIIMIPPIFMCSEGHSMCLTCKTLNCGICGIEVTDIHNIDLEDISTSILHPCRFAEKGCTEVHSCYEIRKHEVYCDYFRYKCPAGCNLTERYFVIKAHVRLLHPSLKIVEDTQFPFPRNSEFVFANKYGIFYCVSPLKVNSIEWTVYFCGVEKISFVCRVIVSGRKGEKVYTLQRHENGYKSVIFLDELKSLRLKDKHAVLHLRDC